MSKSVKDPKLFFALGALVGVLIFILIYGVAVIYPTNDGWLLAKGEDVTQHYLGWKFFRRSQWHFPLGLMDGLCTNETVSVMFTDSIPLLAIFFKVLSPVLPETFQYIGIWGVMSFALMGGLSALLLRKYRPHLPFCLIGCAVFTMSPPVIMRMFVHEGLAGQWIIVLGLLIWAYRGRSWKHRSTPAVLWSVTAVLAVSIHMYLLPMVYAIMLGYVIEDVLKERRIGHSAVCFGSATVCSLVTMFVIGAFHGNVGLTEGGLGEFSANYNSLFNSLGTSRFLPALPIFDGQGEGFGYLGLGMIIGAVGAVVLLVIFGVKKAGSLPDIWKTALPVIAVILVGLFAAASPLGTFGDNVIYDIPYPELIFKGLSSFRASGRFIWIVLYVVYLAIFRVFAKFGKTPAVVIAAVCLAVQTVDLSDWLAGHHREFSSKIRFTPVLECAEMDEFCEGAKRIVFIPLPEDYLAYSRLYFDFAEYAADHDMELSSFYTARSRYEPLAEAADAEYTALKCGSGNSSAVYVFLDIPEIEPSEKYRFCELCGYTMVRFYS